MAATFAFEIVSPERLLLSRPVEMAVIPAAEGEMGVLPGHAPMILSLAGGVISVHEGGQVTERLFVMGGFAEVTPTRVTVLAEEALPVAEITKAEAAKRVAEADAAYAAAVTAGDNAAREAAAARAIAARRMETVAAG
jgi:F-type H+-transporting ATPase subunit epsilon